MTYRQAICKNGLFVFNNITFYCEDLRDDKIVVIEVQSIDSHVVVHRLDSTENHIANVCKIEEEPKQSKKYVLEIEKILIIQSAKDFVRNLSNKNMHNPGHKRE